MVQQINAMEKHCNNVIEWFNKSMQWKNTNNVIEWFNNRFYV